MSSEAKCRTCNDSGSVWSPDPGGESLYESLCPEPGCEASALRQREGFGYALPEAPLWHYPVQAPMDRREDIL
jgi:hypothetical protein